MDNQTQFCTFFLDGHYFGVEAQEVQEVMRYQEMTVVPLAPSVIRGLINLRGQIVTAIDLRRRLELTEYAEDQRPMNIVIRMGDDLVSLLVDEIGDVLELTEDTFESPPRTLRGVARELIRGAYKLQDQLLLVLNTQRAAEVTATV